MTSVSVISFDEDHCIARDGPLIVIVLRGAFTDGVAQGCYMAVEATAAQHRGETSVLVVIEPTAPTPAPEARVRTAQTMRNVANRVTGWAVAVEGSGLRSTIVRSVLVAISLMSRSPLPTKYFENVQGAATWLAGQPGAKVKAEQVAELAGEARARIRAKSA